MIKSVILSAFLQVNSMYKKLLLIFIIKQIVLVFVNGK